MFWSNGTVAKYCSMRCVQKKHVLKCHTCGEQFRGERATIKYCSRRCQGIAMRTERSCTCKQCGTVSHSQDAFRNKFCSKACYDEWRFAGRIPVGKVISCDGCQPFRVEIDVVRGVTLPRPVPVA
jgi:endogenous inhibitor of DNA gyrase (YacG/DUF329 family)